MAFLPFCFVLLACSSHVYSCGSSLKHGPDDSVAHCRRGSLRPDVAAEQRNLEERLTGRRSRTGWKWCVMSPRHVDIVSYMTLTHLAEWFTLCFTAFFNKRNWGRNVRNHVFSPVNTSTVVPQGVGGGGVGDVLGAVLLRFKRCRRVMNDQKRARTCFQIFPSVPFHFCHLAAHLGGGISG